MQNEKQHSKKKNKKEQKGYKRSARNKAKKEGAAAHHHHHQKKSILVIDSPSRNWKECFAEETGVVVEQCEWKQIIVQADSSSQLPLVSIRPDGRGGGGQVFQPHMVLVRQLVRGLTPAEDYTNALYGLMFSNVPSVNTLDSIHNALERPVVYRALQSLQKKLGAERFPLVPMSYYSHHSAMRFTPEFPLVAKVGSAEAGYGKMRFLKQEDLEDFRSVLALHNDYVTLERFIEDRLYDIRVQKIGDHYRAYKRENANWKGNVGTCLLEEIEVTEKFREWAEECGKLFGGMDILTVDAIHTADGKDWILEINDTASGFAPCNLEEDMAVTRQLVLQRLQEAYDSS